MSGKLIVVEGPDRVGKHTQSKMLCTYFANCGLDVKFFEVPYDDSFTYRIIYFMLNNGLARTFPFLFQLIQHANKLLFQRFVLKKALKNHDYVILDRWALSGLVYGQANDVGRSTCQKMFNAFIEPDVTIVLVGNPHIVGSGDSYEADDSMQRRVRALYADESWDRRHRGHILLDSSHPRLAVHDKIVDCLLEEGILTDDDVVRSLHRIS